MRYKCSLFRGSRERNRTDPRRTTWSLHNLPGTRHLRHQNPKIHPTILTVDSVAGLCPFEETLVPPESKEDILKVSGIVLCSAMNYKFALKMIEICVRMRDAIFPLLFRDRVSFTTPHHSRIVVHIKNINTLCTTRLLIRRVDYRLLQIRGHNARKVLAIQHRQPLVPFEQVEHSVDILLTRNTTITPIKQRPITANTPINGLMSLKSHQRTHEQQQCAITNGIAEIQSTQPFEIWMQTFSKSPNDYQNKWP